MEKTYSLILNMLGLGVGRVGRVSCSVQTISEGKVVIRLSQLLGRLVLLAATDTEQMLHI